MLKKFLVLILSLNIFMTTNAVHAAPLVSYDSQESEDELIAFENEIPYEVRQAMENQVDALNNYQNLIDSFSKTETGMPVYPEEYAGAYIENGILIIQLTNSCDSMQSKYIQLCGSSQNIEFKEAVYSLNELMGYETYVVDMVLSGYDVVSYGVCETNNSFDIYLSSESEQPPETFLYSLTEKTDLPINIGFQEPIIACATMWGGDAITNSSGSTISVGICGTYNEKKALLTCGHGNEKTGFFSPQYPTISYSDTQIGQVSYQRANTSELETGISSLGDFAIVTLNDDVTTTNKIWGGVTISGTYSSLPEGTTIYKYGEKTKYSYGKITQAAISSAVAYKNQLGTKIYYVRGLYRSSIQKADGSTPLDHGDSGGPVYIYDGSNYLLHGIVSAGSESTMYSSPIYYAVDAGFSVKIN